ncbi:MAG TPA: hypothetical protein VLA59_07350 [Patescibacteria group bacterium]|nr:hypothetical protein [Patescibacteria group bacterium]
MHRTITIWVALTAVATLTACAASNGSPTSSAPMATPNETANQAATVSPAPSRTASTSPTSTPTEDGGFEDATECESTELGYEVEYPADWWANERIEPGEDDPGLTPILACTFFAAEPVQLEPNTGLPAGIAIQIEVADEEPVVSGETLDEEVVEIDGRDAVRRTVQPTPSPGFIPEGSLMYRYVIELEDGSFLLASTDNILQDDAAYEESRTILDTMMETIEIDG